jgi:hypothetical protein
MTDSKIIILYPYGPKHLGMFKDIENSPNAYLRFSEKKNISSRILKLLRRIHFSKKINQIINLPQKHVWYGYSDIFRLLKTTKHVLIIDSALRDIDDSLLQNLKSKGAIIDLYLINSINAKSPRLLEIKQRIGSNNWHQIYTFDPVDAQEYGFKFRGFDYYSKQKIDIPTNPENDAYFVGGIKGNREGLVNSLYKAITEHGGKCNFDVMVYKSQNPDMVKGIHYIWGNWQPYSMVLDAIANSNTIIEILQDGQSGASLRYFEAVCYNKKLLTNNPHIKEFPFYDERYMKIFSNISDIDYDWICKREPIDYHYNGEFSPQKLINDFSAN